MRSKRRLAGSYDRVPREDVPVRADVLGARWDVEIYSGHLAVDSGCFLQDCDVAHLI